MFGLVITPRKEDFESLTEKQVLDIYRQVTQQQPKIRVGIMAEKEIRFCLNDSFTDGRSVFEGEMQISASGGKLNWNGVLIDSLTLKPSEHGSTFTLHDVTIGIGFHWERKEDQTFSGQLKFIIENGLVRAINILPVEDYLTSVISSEMKPTATREFLKAHAVISRSWVLAQLRSPYHTAAAHAATPQRDYILDRIIKWYDHDQHTLFDVCADDHCQRYQGVTRVLSPQVRQAIAATRGQILVSQGRICDTRFGKCCGGRTNEFQYCWENVRHPYLTSVSDPFCNIQDPAILRRVLNDYDLETTDFYRWHVEYSQEELKALITSRLKIDLGDILNLESLEAGPGGHISRLLIVGSLRSFTVGKELEIRRTLSTSHLMSSAFTVQLLDVRDGVPQRIRLDGKGWGHGVGLCQIGAAVMGHQGYPYRKILSHYYTGAQLKRVY
jgi:SpoIID/LytB domain protein